MNSAPCECRKYCLSSAVLPVRLQRQYGSRRRYFSANRFSATTNYTYKMLIALIDITLLHIFGLNCVIYQGINALRPKQNGRYYYYVKLRVAHAPGMPGAFRPESIDWSKVQNIDGTKWGSWYTVVYYKFRQHQHSSSKFSWPCPSIPV